MEDIKRKKLEELQAVHSHEEQLRQQIEAAESLVKSKLTKKALERLGNIKVAHPEIYFQAVALLTNLIQTGKAGEVNDVQLKEILKMMSPKKKEFKIKS